LQFNFLIIDSLLETETLALLAGRKSISLGRNEVVQGSQDNWRSGSYRRFNRLSFFHQSDVFFLWICDTCKDI